MFLVSFSGLTLYNCYKQVTRFRVSRYIPKGNSLTVSVLAWHAADPGY